MSKLPFVAVLLLTLTVNGCALSPQTVALLPAIDARAEPIGQKRTLAITVIDQRPQPVFGYRGGVYRTAAISARTDVVQAIRDAVAERMQASDFTIASEPGPGPGGLSLTINLRNIDYSAEKTGIYNEIKAVAIIDVVARNGAASRQGHYESSKIHHRLTYPSAQENELMLNDVVAQVLQQMFQDQAMIALLARS